MKRYEITIEGMGCQHCIDAVNASLRDTGAAVISVELGLAIADYDGDPSVLGEAVEDRGFDVKGIKEI